MALPAASALTGSSITEAQFKSAITDLRDYIANLETVTPGAVAYFPKTAAPTGWLKCNGAAVSRTTYAALFAAIGTAAGAGDGSTTFNVPDLRGEFVRGLDDGRGVDSGRSMASAQASANLAHTHSTDSQGAHTHPVRGITGTDDGLHVTNDNSNPANGLHGNINTSSAGAHTHTALSSGGAEARPRNVALLACIKY
jgi:microcystin-dependent protein